MAYTLDQIRAYVRAHMDLDSTELPDTLLDVWCREATTKVVNFKQRWPFLENRWTLSASSGTDEYLLSSLVDGSSYTPSEVTSVVRDNFKLHWIGRDEAEKRFLPGTANSGQSVYFNTWGDRLTLYPTPSVAEDYTVRGYRKVKDWVSAGAGSPPDLPDDFHDPIRLYVLGSAYLQQEDPEMAGNYYNSFEDEMEKLVKSYGEASPAAPFIMGGGPRSHYPQGRLAFPWD